MTPREVYIAVLRYQFSDLFLSEHINKKGERYRMTRREAWPIAKARAADYAFHHKYSNNTVSVRVW